VYVQHNLIVSKVWNCAFIGFHKDFFHLHNCTRDNKRNGNTHKKRAAIRNYARGWFNAVSCDFLRINIRLNTRSALWAASLKLRGIFFTVVNL